jgi:multisubunit Na+/H+ antiporter MnhB subunit
LSRKTSNDKPTVRFAPARIVAVLLTLGVAVILAQAVQGLSEEPGGLTDVAAGRVEESGVEHPVTAVLLNFRAYDTFLEIGVLLLAALGVLAVRREDGLASAREMPGSRLHNDPMLQWLVRLLAPVMMLAGGYLLWLGTSAPGGAFHAGAMLAAAGVILRMAGHPSIAMFNTGMLRVALLVGFIAFLITAFGTLLFGGGLLELPQTGTGLIILFIELAVTVSIAFTLVALFVGGQTVPGDGTDETS